MRVVLWIYLVASLVTFAVYAIDKHRAATRGWRVPEVHLHLLALVGGWPGALAAMKLIRHKNRKGRFLLVTGVIVILHAGAWAVYLLRG
jgi:uncharacterized membrane protein YsdA (DUF1294 family)